MKPEIKKIKGNYLYKLNIIFDVIFFNPNLVPKEEQENIVEEVPGLTQEEHDKITERILKSMGLNIDFKALRDYDTPLQPKFNIIDLGEEKGEEKVTESNFFLKNQNMKIISLSMECIVFW